MTDYDYQAEYDDPPERGRRRPGAAAGHDARESPYYPIEADDPYGAYAGDGYDWTDEDGNAEADAAYAPVGVAGGGDGRVSVAEAGRAAARRIRFDPTQERGTAHYDRAHRHSRTVRSLKVALPALALFGIGAFVAFVQFAPAPDEAVITLSGINVEEKSVTMDRPHVSGFEGTRKAYEVHAVTAVQDLNNPKIMTMHTITAKIGMEDGQTAHIQAATGRYDGDARTLYLSDGIALRTTKGYRATLQDANVEIATSNMTSDKPVEIVTDQGTVKANAVEVKENGKHVIFSKGVNVVFTPADEEPEAVADPAGPADPGTIPAGETPEAETAASGSST